MSHDETQDARAIARDVYGAALAAVAPDEAVLRALRLDGEVLRVGGEQIDLDVVGAIWVLGAGKAARGMAVGAVELLVDLLAGGAIVVPDRLGRALPGIDVWEARHPLPDTRGLAAASEALRVARAATADDLVLCLLSGGASALWSAPVEGVTLGDLQQVTDALLQAGAPISEVNTVRRHLSRIGGGMLARAAAPARVLTLAISDVAGGAAHDIGSGPTSSDPTTYADALAVLASRGVPAPAAVLHHLRSGVIGQRPETLKPGEVEPEPSVHVIASLRDALAAAAEEAMRLGYPATVLTDHLAGAARLAGEDIAREVLVARETVGDGRGALIWGGETTVEVRGPGRGGRNQELALAAARALENVPGVVVAALATDGIDGPTPAAGAIIDGYTIERARAAGFDPEETLARNDSHTLLAATGDAVVTGPTGTNVNDLVIALIG